MSSLTKAQALKIIAKMQEPGFVPFLGAAAVICDVPRAVAEQAHLRGSVVTGSDLEKVFFAAVEKCKAKFVIEALSVINDPNLTRADEPRARQLMNILVRLDRATFGTSIPKATQMTGLPDPTPPKEMSPDAVELAKAVAELEKKE